MRKTGPHGLSQKQADVMAHERGQHCRATLPNHDGFVFWGYGADGWLYKCSIKRGSDGTHRVIGEATYDEIVGWKATRNCQMPYCVMDNEDEDSNICPQCRATIE